jgi:hypothetical protein
MIGKKLLRKDEAICSIGQSHQNLARDPEVRGRAVLQIKVTTKVCAIDSDGHSWAVRSMKILPRNTKSDHYLPKNASLQEEIITRETAVLLCDSNCIKCGDDVSPEIIDLIYGAGAYLCS